MSKIVICLAPAEFWHFKRENKDKAAHIEDLEAAMRGEKAASSLTVSDQQQQICKLSKQIEVLTAENKALEDKLANISDGNKVRDDVVKALEKKFGIVLGLVHPYEVVYGLEYALKKAGLKDITVGGKVSSGQK